MGRHDQVSSMKKGNLGPAILALCVLSSCAHYEASEPVDAIEPQRDYAAVLSTFDQIVGQALFDPRVLDSPEWQSFRGKFGRDGAVAVNDTEFRQAFENARKSSSLFSHFEVWTKSNATTKPADADATIAFELISDDIGVLKIPSFDEPGLYVNLDASFDEIVQLGVANLIVDLRGNPGGTFAAWPVLDRTAKDEYRIGQLVANRWYSNNSDAPSVSQIMAAEPQTAPDPAALGQDLMDDGLLALAVKPRGARFTGKIYVLIDQETASTSEIVASTLQYNSLATIVGTRSAGEVLNAEPMPLAEGITLLLPVADFMLPDGTRLEGSGVLPDVAASQAEALSCAIRLSQGHQDC